MKTVILLLCSNIFMTIAWYWHLKATGMPYWKVILISWTIALFEYCLTVPANRSGYLAGWNGFQLKIVQEIISLLIFTIFAVIVLKEPLHWRYVASLACIFGAVYFAFKK